MNPGGAPAIQVEVTGTSSPPGCSQPPNRILLFDTTDQRLFVRPGETIRLIAADVGSTLVVVIARADTDDFKGLSSQAARDEFQSALQPVLDSLHFVRPEG